MLEFESCLERVQNMGAERVRQSRRGHRVHVSAEGRVSQGRHCSDFRFNFVCIVFVTMLVLIPLHRYCYCYRFDFFTVS